MENLKINRTFNGTIIHSEKTLFAASLVGREVNIFTDAEIPASLIDDLDNSGIVKVIELDRKKGFINMQKKDFFCVDKFEKIVLFIFEKYSL
ncbi:MAG: hypothetical protein LBN95_03910 [Prevotellaceae bacterium]|jgi:hypothetical protein|nr:hypothetical protein [Prevotellaceae bacterium]